MFKQRIFVFFGNRYSFKADNGQQLEGSKVFYLSTDDMKPIDDLQKANSKGYRYAQASLPYDTLGHLPYVPGVYDGEFEPATDSKGSMTLKLVNLIPVGPVALNLKSTVDDVKSGTKK